MFSIKRLYYNNVCREKLFKLGTYSSITYIHIMQHHIIIVLSFRTAVKPEDKF